MTGYSRERFGPSWLDADRNGCDTRNDILADYLDDIIYKPGTNNCVVEFGTITDVYTGKRIDFVKGDGSSIDIDHVIALGNAWVSGAWRWDIRQRAAIANDPLNLLPVDFSANRQKGDADAATWLPPVKSYRCHYVARQIAVKAKYGLSITTSEKSAIGAVLDDCPDFPLPDDSTGAPIRVDHNITDPGAEDGSPEASSGSTSGTGSGIGSNIGSSTGGDSDPVDGKVTGQVHYSNCTEVRAAGAAPIRKGDAGYGRHLDRDGDGSACE